MEEAWASMSMTPTHTIMIISQNLLFLVVAGVFVAAAAGYLGSFMVLKRMALVGDALSHVALPGLAIALMFNFSPMLGAAAALSLAVIGIWYLEKTSRVYPEALVGVFFTASLAIGVLITPQTELLEALFGDIEKMTHIEGLAAIAFSILIIIFTYLISKKLIIGIISDEMAKSMGISLAKINFFYLLLVGAIVALGIKFVGSLLMGALVIVPAASAKNVSIGMRSYYLLSILFGIISAIIGILLATSFGFATGPIVVITSIVIFLITYIFKKG